MKVVLCLFACLTFVVAMPQQEGGAFTNEAIAQAQKSNLIPAGATIHNVQRGVELAAYENIPGNQRISLEEILGGQIPREVIENLSGQIDSIGRN